MGGEVLRLKVHAISHFLPVWDISSFLRTCRALCRRFKDDHIYAHAAAVRRAGGAPPRGGRLRRRGGAAPGRGAPGAPPCARDMSSGGRARGAGVRRYWSAASRALLPRAGRGRWGPAGGAASHGAGAARPRHPVPRAGLGRGAGGRHSAPHGAVLCRYIHVDVHHAVHGVPVHRDRLLQPHGAAHPCLGIYRLGYTATSVRVIFSPRDMRAAAARC